MNETKKGIHYAWWILISCCCIYAGSMALTQSIAGVYMLPVSQAIGVSRGDFGLWLTASTIVTVITLPFWGRFMQTKNINVVLSVGVVFLIVGILGFSFSTQLWMFLVCGALCGVGMGPTFALCGPTLVQNWFAPAHRGKMLGIAAAFTGVGTFIWAPLFTSIIQSQGWQTAYLINAILAAVLMLPFSLFVVKFKPEDKGLKPFGYKQGEEESAKLNETGIKARAVFKYVAFYGVAIGAVFCCIGMGYNSNQPGLALEKLVPLGETAATAAMVGGLMISVAAVGNIVGKVVFGALGDRIGIKPTFAIFMLLYILAFVVWLIFSDITMLYVGAFLLGTHNALLSVGFPVLARRLFGNKDYPKIWSYLAMPYTLVSGFGTALVGYIYQGTGSYTMSLYVGIGLVVIATICSFVALASLGKIKWNGDEQEEKNVLE